MSSTTLAFDVTSAVKPLPGGVARYTLQVLREMAARLGPEDRLRLGYRLSRWKHREHAPRLDDPRVRLRPYASPFAFLAFGGAQLYHGLGVNVPLGLGRIPRVVTVHAIFQDSYRKGEGRGTKLLRATSRADVIIVPSEHDRARAIAALGLAPDRIVAIHHGVDSTRFRATAEPDDPRVVAEAGVASGRPFALALGSLNPVKNYAGLIEAFARSRARATHDLVLAGSLSERGRGVEDLVARLGVGSCVRLLGFVPHASVPALLRTAQALVLPSLYESFGLPLVEAMSCGAPVIHTNVAALPEVAGGAGEACETDPDAIAQALDRVLLSPERQAELRRLGLARAERFTWKVTVDRTLEVYARLLGRPVFAYAARP